jgi:LuxR family transcriptional regulator, maltose regulon positive regulatory protein
VVGDARKKVIDVKRAIHRSGVPRVIIKTFGGFQLFRDEIPLEESAWEAIQPKLLLKAIIAHRSHGVPKDVLIEALWPDVPPVSGERNFKVILHRLRKTLEPEMDKNFGSSYIHLKANLVSLDEELCHIDIDDFYSLCRRGERKQEEGDIKSAVALFKQAVDLYTGDFLAEDLYASWADAKRNELRDRYIGLLYRVGELLEKQGNLKSANEYYKHIIQLDPTLEPAYQQLILNYANRGMRSAALKTYEDCIRVLRKELDIEPDALTTSLYKRVLDT